ncbi:hypothetical protein AEQ48_04125 [Pseudomonas libanensis]|uniref:Uncharacterized protein n=1 Tax=Pseudomonas libanensis TaxID=75588 RepID=A0ABR5MDX6_9PSED|nr:hypothetical protein AEQ48_04125 [Pseudomonas libanensis]
MERYRLLCIRKSRDADSLPGTSVWRAYTKPSDETEISFTGFRGLYALHRNHLIESLGLWQLYLQTIFAFV